MATFQTPEEEVRHPDTSHERLAQIAQQRPDLANAVVWHPNVYDGLLDWIGAHGDEAAKSAVASKRAQAATPVPPAPAAPTPAPAAPETPSYAPTSDGGYAPTPNSGYPQPAEGDFAQPSTAGAAPAQTALADGYVDPTQPHAMDQSGAVPVVPFGGQAPAKKSRKGVVIGGIVTLVLVVALGVGAFWAYNTFFRGAASPEAAVENMLDGVLQGDPVALMTAFAPSEINAFKDSFDTLASIEAEEFDQEEMMENLLALHGTLDIETEGMEYTTDYITDDIAVVYLTGGIITVDADPAEFADAAVNAVEPLLTTQMEVLDLTQGEIARELDEMRDEAREWARDTFPVTADIDDAIYDIMRDNQSGDFDIESPFMMVTVEEDGWYISPLLTTAEYVTVAVALDQGVKPSSLRGNTVVEPAQFDTPEDAIVGVTQALEDFVAYGKTDDLAAVMSLPERRVLSLYVPDLPDEAVDVVDLTIEEPVTEIEVDGDLARATFLELTATMSDRNEVTVEYRNGCFTLFEKEFNEEEQFCMSDEPMFGELGIRELRGTFVKEDGGWLASPIATYADYVAIIAEAVQEHSERGTLEDLFDSTTTLEQDFPF